MILKIIKKVVFAFMLLFSFNIISTNFNIVLPINILSLVFVTIFDLPGVMTMLLVMQIII